MAMQVSNINEYSGAIVYSGTGELNVLGGTYKAATERRSKHTTLSHSYISKGHTRSFDLPSPSVRPSRHTGVMILTGVNNVEAFALGSTFGVGFEYTIGAGVAVFTGSPFNEYNGLYFFVRSSSSSISLFLFPPSFPSFLFTTHILPLTSHPPVRQAVLGEITFLGSGVMIQTGCPYAEYVAQASENGQVRREEGEGGRVMGEGDDKVLRPSLPPYLPSLTHTSCPSHPFTGWQHLHRRGLRVLDGRGADRVHLLNVCRHAGRVHRHRRLEEREGEREGGGEDRTEGSDAALD